MFSFIPAFARLARWCAGFVMEQAPQSSARLIAVSATVVCGAVATGAIVFAFKNPDKAATVAALATVVTAMGGLVGWALTVRKPNDPPGGPPGGDS